MIWFGRLFVFFLHAFAETEKTVEFREVYAPVIVDDLPFVPVRIQLNEGIVRGRKVTVFNKEIEVYRGLLICIFFTKYFTFYMILRVLSHMLCV